MQWEFSTDNEDDLENRMNYLEEQGIVDDSYDVSRPSNDNEQFPDELKILLSGLVMPKNEFEKLQKKDKLPKPDLSTAALQLLYRILVRRRAAYPLDNDGANGQAGSAPNAHRGAATSQRRRDVARQVIEGELAVLQEAAEAVQELLAAGKKRKADTFEQDALNLQSSEKKQKEKSKT